jgi:hypothetical protein
LLITICQFLIKIQWYSLHKCTQSCQFNFSQDLVLSLTKLHHGLKSNMELIAHYLHRQNC